MIRYVPARVPGTSVVHVAQVLEQHDDEVAIAVRVAVGAQRLRPVCPGSEACADLEPVPEGAPVSWCGPCHEFWEQLLADAARPAVTRVFMGYLDPVPEDGADVDEG